MDYFEEVKERLSDLKFRKKLFGGLDEDDVYKKLEELTMDVEKAFEKQQAYYTGLLEEHGVEL